MGDVVAMNRGASTESVSKLDRNDVENLAGSDAFWLLYYHGDSALAHRAGFERTSSGYSGEGSLSNKSVNYREK